MKKNNQNESQFLSTYIPIFLERFSISYELDNSCLEYFLYSKEKKKEISRSIVVSHEVFNHNLYVSKFYPEIYKEIHCKYLSAAFFYLMIHHAVDIFHLSDKCNIDLETEKKIFHSFYEKLNDFHFKINFKRPAQKVCLKGLYQKLAFSTDMITIH